MMLIEWDRGRKRIELVSGLVWHPLQGDGSARQREVLAYAGAQSADLKVVRGDEAPHVGLARSGEGARPGQVSAAAVIADVLLREGHRSVLVALALPRAEDSFLYLAVRDTVILADGDLTGDAAQVRERLTGDKAYGGWDLVICPAEWGVPDAAGRGFDDFFSDDTLRDARAWQLREVRVNRAKLAVVASVAAALALGGGYGWLAWQKRQAIAAAIARAEQQQRDEAAARPVDPSTLLPPRPWPAMPAPATFARACAEALLRVGTTAGNWKLDGAACENGFLSVRWIKAGEAAWVSHLKAIRPDARVAPDGLSATVSTPIQAPPAGERAEPLQDAAAVRLRLFDLASRYGMSIRLDAPQQAVPPPVLPGQSAPPPPPPPRWAEAPVQATAGFDPVQAAILLDAPGLRFQKLVFSFGRDGLPQYQFSGVQYVRPQ